MYFTVYQITNKLNGKIYVGTHQTEDLNDGYMGSGTKIIRAVNKYGVENFDKTFLHFFDDVTTMLDKEAEIVNEDFVAREDTYNIKLGGLGGWHDVNYGENKDKHSSNKEYLSADAQQRMTEGSKKGAQKMHEYIREKEPEIYKRNSQIAVKSRQENPEPYKRNLKTTLKRINHQQGTINSQYGIKVVWLCNDLTNVNRKLKEDSSEIQTLLNSGWRIGKIIKNVAKGSKASQYGKVWIFNESLKKNTSIDKHSPLLQSLLDNGWKYGRKIKWN